MDKKWVFHKPTFEYEELYNDIGGPWAGHKYFSYDLVRYLSSNNIVELGTHLGCSLFSFSQAVKDGKLNTSLFAIDTWTGDEHSGKYDEIVFNRVKEIKAKKYRNIKIKFVRKNFDKAKSDFKSNSIDLLHIDGMHTYSAIKHDFENWIDKVNKNGVVLIHDTSVKKWGFGIYKYWEEINNAYHTFEFEHSYGLGVLFKSKPIFNKMKGLIPTFKLYYPTLFRGETFRWERDKSNKILERLEKKVEEARSSPIKMWRFYKNGTRG